MQPQRNVDEAPTPQRQRRRSSQRQWCRSVRRVERPPVAPATVAPPRDCARMTSRSASASTSPSARFARPATSPRGSTSTAPRSPQRDRTSPTPARPRGPGGQMTIAQMLRNHVTSETRGPDQERGPKITASVGRRPTARHAHRGGGARGPPADHDGCPCRRQQHVPLLPRGVGQERSVRHLHVPLSRVVHP